MDAAWEKFHQRQAEVDAYFRFLKGATSAEPSSAQPDPMAQKVLKASTFLLLYNVVEGTVSDAFSHVYQVFSGRAHAEVIPNVRGVWVEHRLRRVNLQEATVLKFQGLARELVEDIVGGRPVDGFLSRYVARGNLDAGRIEKVAAAHGIKVTAVDARGELERVVKVRNNLAHGIYAYTEVGGSETYAKLDASREAVIGYLTSFLTDVASYINSQAYLARARR